MNNLTSINAASAITEASAHEFAIDSLMMDLENCLPAIVVSYDRAKNSATVRPLIYNIDTFGDVNSRGECYNIPVLALGGGNKIINFPVAAGDLGWIKACDRDISLFKQSMSESKPLNKLNYLFTNGHFIPDWIYRGFTINGEDSGAAVFQTVNGFARVAVDDTAIRITAGGSKITVTDTEVTIQAATTTINASSAVNITSPQTTVNGGFTVNGMSTLNGGLAANPGSGGGATATMNVPLNVTQGVTANTATVAGIVMESHKHTTNAIGADTSTPHN